MEREREANPTCSPAHTHTHRAPHTLIQQQQHSITITHHPTTPLSPFPQDLMITVIEFIVYANVIFYTFVQLQLAFKTLRRDKSLTNYYSDIWNLLEIVVLVAFYVSTYLRFTLFFSLKPSSTIFENYYTDFFSIGKLYGLTFNLDSICVIALCFKLLKYAQLNLSMSMLWSVLTLSGKDVMFFIIMLLLLLAGFSMMALQFFGPSINEYSTIITCVIELILVLLGQFDVDGMKQASPNFGRWFFLAYILTIVLIMMNIFLAILGEAYTVVRSENDEIIATQVKTKSRGFMGWMRILRAVIKAKLKNRKMRKLTGGRGKVKRSAELPPPEDPLGGGNGDGEEGGGDGGGDGVEMQMISATNGGGEKKVSFK